MHLYDRICRLLPRPVNAAIKYADGQIYPLCPLCKSPLDREYMAYCDRCGQKLSWSSPDDPLLPSL